MIPLSRAYRMKYFGSLKVNIYRDWAYTDLIWFASNGTLMILARAATSGTNINIPSFPAISSNIIWCNHYLNILSVQISQCWKAATMYSQWHQLPCFHRVGISYDIKLRKRKQFNREDGNILQLSLMADIIYDAFINCHNVCWVAAIFHLQGGKLSAFSCINTPSPVSSAFTD